MRVEVLGAVRAWRQEQELTLGQPRQRALLAAREAWQHALAILEGLNHPDVTPFRARLARVS